MSSGAKPQEAEEFSRIFVLKVTLLSVMLPSTVSYRKKLEEQDVLLAPPIILLGEAPPVPMLMKPTHRWCL